MEWRLYWTFYDSDLHDCIVVVEIVFTKLFTDMNVCMYTVYVLWPVCACTWYMYCGQCVLVHGICTVASVCLYMVYVLWPVCACFAYVHVCFVHVLFIVYRPPKVTCCS